MKRLLAAACAALAVAAPAQVWAWGSTGHRLIGQAAMRALPGELPAFLRTAQAADDVGELSREPDRLKRAGRAFDSDRDQGHFLDVGDDGAVFGGPKVTALPPTREDYEKALQSVGQNSWRAGYLPYSILESYQVLTQNFAYWKVLAYAEANPAWAAHKAWFAADRARREKQILSAIGDLSHFVGDGSQPLHATIHFNGWGDFPNPRGYTTSRQFHAAFEGDLVKTSVKLADVQAGMSPPKGGEEPLDAHVGAYLAAANAQVVPLYELEKAGGMTPGDPRGGAFATRQIAVGASELRDLIVQAWHGADRQTVGWRQVAVADVLAGKVDPYNALSGVD